MTREGGIAQGAAGSLTLRSRPLVFQTGIMQLGLRFVSRARVQRTLAVLALLHIRGLSAAGQPSAAAASAPGPVAYFTDVAEKSGLAMLNVFGGIDTKKFIPKPPGPVAIFDYGNDGWPDIFR